MSPPTLWFPSPNGQLPPASAIDIFLAPNPILFIDALAVASIAILTDRNGSPFPGQKGVGGEVVAHFGSTRSTNLPSSGLEDRLSAPAGIIPYPIIPPLIFPSE